ncbi:MAG: hypothetical protein NUV81_00945 [bacterium]|nr:hypothetical protein [bacterium]
MPQNPPPVVGSCTYLDNNTVPSGYVYICFEANTGKSIGVYDPFYLHIGANGLNGYFDCWDSNNDNIPDGPQCGQIVDVGVGGSDSVAEWLVPLAGATKLKATVYMASGNLYWGDVDNYVDGGCGNLQGTLTFYDEYGFGIKYTLDPNEAPYYNANIAVVP